MREEFEAQSCRICLTKTKKLRSLYQPIDEGDEPPNEMLQKITGIQVEKLDEHIMLPKNICKNCELSLSMAFEFRDNALKTQQMIASYIKNLNEPETPKEKSETTHSKFKYFEDFEMAMQTMDIVVDALDDNLTDCNLQIEHVDSDSESVIFLSDNQELIEQNPEYLLGDNEDSFNDDNENYTDHHPYNENERAEDEERIEDENEDEEEEAEQEGLETSQQKDIKVSDSIALHKSIDIKIDTKSWANISKSFVNVENQEDEDIAIKHGENIKQIPRRGRKPLNSSKNMDYICDVCGNIFAKRSRMMEHRQRHDKELKYSCELCDQKFHMRELLRKHMYSHSGGKPYKCEFCSRTFYYESVKKGHEAVHQGHKPYVCDFCGKAFGYAHALKKHKLIHAEIKLYRCEYCNKDFRLQHHLKQHELTRMHQNAVHVAGMVGTPGHKCVSGDGDADPNDVIHEEHDLTDEILLVEEIAEDQLVNGN